MDQDKMHFKDYRSGMLTNGIERSAHRALLYSTGLDEADLHKPMIAVVNSFTEMVPGHFHLRELVDFVKQGIIEAGGIPREFNTIAICDGICQGHKGMSYPLPSREIIADSTEFMVEAHQFDGMVMLPGCGLAHAVSAKKRRIAKQSGRRIVEMVKEDLTPRKIMTREALRNGIKVSMAMGASTNSTLHLPAIAHEGGIDLSLDDFDQLSREVPYLCNIKPSGQYPLSVLEECGGIPAVMKAVESKLDLNQLTVTGKTVGENLADVELVENDVIFPLEHPKRPEGGLAILHGNLAPDGAVVKQAGVKPSMHYFKGRARVFTSMEDASYAVSNDQIRKGDVLVIRYEGPKGGPGMREMHMTCSLIVGRGMDEDCALITDGRFSGSTRGPCIGHISPEAAAGGPIAAVEEGDEIIIDIPNRTLTLCVPEEEIQRRLQAVKHIRKPATPGLARYASLVTSADQGAVLKLPEEAGQEGSQP